MILGLCRFIEVIPDMSVNLLTAARHQITN